MIEEFWEKVGRMGITPSVGGTHPLGAYQHAFTPGLAQGSSFPSFCGGKLREVSTISAEIYVFELQRMKKDAAGLLFSFEK
jgi:hypothetical protein